MVTVDHREKGLNEPRLFIGADIDVVQKITYIDIDMSKLTCSDSLHNNTAKKKNDITNTEIIFFLQKLCVVFQNIKRIYFFK